VRARSAPSTRCSARVPWHGHHYLIVRQQRDAYPEGHGPQQIADTFVSIFLDGIRRRDGDGDV
jgi:hypothetical protein